MEMPGRKYQNAGLYRYGFNGKENDNEVKGSGNQQDYGMRIYDPRIGKFLSSDPLTSKYPELTPYQFASNTPICAIDLDGLEGFIPTGVNGHGMIITPETANEINKRVVVSAFKAVFSEVLPKKFIEHYAYGKGKTYYINRSEIIHQIKPWPTGVDGITAEDKEKFAALIKDAKPGSEVQLPKGYSIEGAALTGGTLGRFTIYLRGKVVFDTKDVTKWTFVGTMQLFDQYDFITKPVGDKNLQRNDWSNQQTNFAFKNLPGEGFEVWSQPIAVEQTSEDYTFTWFIGKPTDGKQNEISNIISDCPVIGDKIQVEIRK